MAKWSASARRSIRKYHAYKKALSSRKKMLRSKGLEPYNVNGSSEQLSYRDWKAIYTEELNDRRKEVESGERKSVGNINAKIVSDQVYELSEEQAYAIFDYMRDLPPEERRGFKYRNINQAISILRQGEYVRDVLGLWDIIREDRDNMFKMSDAQKTALMEKWKDAKTFKEAVRYEISQTYFKSP